VVTLIIKSCYSYISITRSVDEKEAKTCAGLPLHMAVAYLLKTCSPINLIPMREITIANSFSSNKVRALGPDGAARNLYCLSQASRGAWG
jgi:hypothetical protein